MCMREQEQRNWKGRQKNIHSNRVVESEAGCVPNFCVDERNTGVGERRTGVGERRTGVGELSTGIGERRKASASMPSQYKVTALQTA